MIQEPGFQISQLVVLVVVLVCFWVGIICRSWVVNQDQLTGRQFFALIVIGFFALALPLCSTVHSAILAAGADLFIILSALVPPLLSGFTARGDISRMF